MNIAAIEPISFTKGDSLSWCKMLSDYPASSWALTYYIRGTASLDVVATSDGDTHVVSLTTAQTATLDAGDYWWQAKASKGADIVTVASGQFTVFPSLNDTVAGHDGRSHVKRTLDALEAMIEKRATLDQQSYSINGRSLSRMTMDEILAWADKYRRFYRDELRQLGVQQGLGRGRNVKIRFND